MKAFATLYLAALASASALVARDATTIVNDLNGIGSQLTSLDSSLKGFSGDNSAALAIQQAAQTLIKAIESATTDVGTTPLNDADSGNVANAVLALQDPIKNALSDIVAAMAGLNNALPGASSIVAGDLNQLKSDTDALGKALVAVLTPTFASLAPSIIGQIDDEFNTAIAAYANAPPVSSSAGPSSSTPTSVTPTSAPPSSGATSVAPSSAPVSSGASSAASSAASSGAGSAPVSSVKPTAGSSAASSAASTAVRSSAMAGTTPTAKSTPTPAPYTGAASKLTSFTFGSAILMVLGFAL